MLMLRSFAFVRFREDKVIVWIPMTRPVQFFVTAWRIRDWSWSPILRVPTIVRYSYSFTLPIIIRYWRELKIYIGLECDIAKIHLLSGLFFISCTTTSFRKIDLIQKQWSRKAINNFILSKIFIRIRQKE